MATGMFFLQVGVAGERVAWRTMGCEGVYKTSWADPRSGKENDSKLILKG